MLINNDQLLLDILRIGVNISAILIISSLFIIYIYFKYISIRSVFSIKYSNQIDELRERWYLYPVWKYLDINRYVFRIILLRIFIKPKLELIIYPIHRPAVDKRSIDTIIGYSIMAINCINMYVDTKTHYVSVAKDEREQLFFLNFNAILPFYKSNKCYPETFKKWKEKYHWDTLIRNILRNTNNVEVVLVNNLDGKNKNIESELINDSTFTKYLKTLELIYGFKVLNIKIDKLKATKE